ncbi:protein lysB [Paraburkholderia sp. G-4-1-8]|uniref:Protein lysB n=1 Tax=Paraburkholderia antibiotica TaxID=2728839 RepID=A0A7X9X5J6_9BURK|nr:protein lysB [Paraburkholderia antibiotica]
MTLRIGVILAAVIALFGGVYYVRGLQADVQTAQQAERDAKQSRDEAKQQVANRDQVIEDLKRSAAERDAQQKQLEASRSKVESELARLHDDYRRILNESPEAREWADTRLPADIARLQTGAAITGACGFYQRMSDGDALQTSCNGTDDEWRPEQRIDNR